MTLIPTVIINFKEDDEVEALKTALRYYRAIGANVIQIVLHESSNAEFSLPFAERVGLRISVFKSNSEQQHIRIQECLNNVPTDGWVLIVNTNELFSFALAEVVGLQGVAEFMEARGERAVLATRVALQCKSMKDLDIERLLCLNTATGRVIEDLFLASHIEAEGTTNYPFVDFYGRGKPYKNASTLSRVPLFKMAESVALDANLLPSHQPVLTEITAALIDVQKRSINDTDNASRFTGTKSLLELGLTSLTRDFADWCFNSVENAQVSPNARAIDSVQAYKQASFIDGRREYSEYSDLLSVWNNWISSNRTRHDD